MWTYSKMIQKNLLVENKLGIHARPAGRIVEITSKAKSSVQMRFEGVKANAKSILNVMMLAVEPGAEVEFTIEGEDELSVMASLEKLFSERFFED
jgi:phosphocarrier protein HPr